MPARPEVVEKIARLVHHRELARDEAERCLKVLEGGGATLEEALARGAGLSPEEIERLRRTKEGEFPEVPGYVVEGRVGVGGTAEVFRAREEQGDRTVALKVLRDDLASDPAARDRFVAEARLLLALEHENLVKGFRVARTRLPSPRALAGESAKRDVYFFAMEFVDGPTVLELLDRRGPLPEEDALYVVLQVARVLEYLRGKGVLHRDIKPGNILVAKGNKVKLIDLGFASTGGAPAASASAVGSGTTSGTVHYISPEQARGDADLDVRSDIYSLGGTLYHLVFGELPFSGADDAEVLRRQVLESLSSATLKGRKVSPHLHYFLEKMMAKEKEIRYSSPAELMADIEAQIAGRQWIEATEGPRGVRPKGDLLGRGAPKKPSGPRRRE
jgi:serine/threonine-protein kinase